MAYEGLNVPAITHLILLNNYRSPPWLEQCLGRATRYDNHPSAGSWQDQQAYVFIPADPLANDVIQQIIDEDNIPYDGDGKRLPLGVSLLSTNQNSSSPIDVTINASNT